MRVCVNAVYKRVCVYTFAKDEIVLHRSAIKETENGKYFTTFYYKFFVAHFSDIKQAITLNDRPPKYRRYI